MKKILLFFATIICSISFSQSTLVGLVLETVDNSSAGFNNGEVTYRLYAELNGGLITFIFADESNPLEISTSSTFVDDTYGSDIQGLINPGFFAFVPSLDCMLCSVDVPRYHSPLASLQTRGASPLSSVPSC